MDGPNHSEARGIVDVAPETGVPTATVSFVCGRKNPVAEATHERVLKVSGSWAISGTGMHRRCVAGADAVPDELPARCPSRSFLPQHRV